MFLVCPSILPWALNLAMAAKAVVPSVRHGQLCYGGVEGGGIGVDAADFNRGYLKMIMP